MSVSHVLLASLLMLSPAKAAASMSGEPRSAPAGIGNIGIYSVVLLDILPGRKADGAALLTHYAAALSSVDGCLRAELVRQPPPMDNHFAILSMWRSAAERDRHLASEIARDFRTALQPLTASPVDDRVYAGMPP